MDYADIATTAVADVQETFKRVYLMALDAVPDATPLTAQLNRSKKFRAGPDGLYFNVKLETGGAVANVSDGKLLPRPTHPQRKQGKVGLAHTYTVVAVGGQSIPLTEENRQAFVSNLQDNLEDAMIRVRNDLERQYNGDGLGILAVVETVASAPTYDVHKPYGITAAGPGTMLFIEDMDIAAINPSGGAERDRQKVTDVDVDNEQITTGAAITGAVIGDYLVLCNDVTATGTDAENNYQSEATGILSVAATGDTFENIDGTAYRRWNGVVMDNGGTTRKVTEKLLAVLEARLKAFSGRKPNLHYTTRGISIDLQDQLAGLRRFSGETATLKGGYEGLQIGGRTVLEGDWCPKQHWFCLNTDRDAVGMADLVPMGFVDLDGAKLHRVEGRHAFRADLWFPHEALWFMRSCQGVLKDLEDDQTIVR
ncbi:MAG: phage major capsid protein [Gammaproteobacteria bacterium]|nr:MAG: phage major capsid protein [Gammaproteobacteria bacterium]